jgi:glycine hydroxymethyltransferase
MASTPSGLKPLSEADPELFDLIEKEKSRQWHSLELIASENFTSKGKRKCSFFKSQVVFLLRS